LKDRFTTRDLILNSGVVGESAAIVTSFLWTISSLFFTSAGKKIGVLGVNAYRIIIAIALLAATHLILLGAIIPLAGSGQWFWMGLSGIVGLGIGDTGLFAAYVTIGPRRSVLIMALAPIFAAAAAYLLLGETIPRLALVGIAITLTGVVMVILEAEDQTIESQAAEGRKAFGVLFGLVGAIGQGVGLALAKKGIYLDPASTLNPISATLMRLLLGAAFIWTLALVTRRLPSIISAVNDRKGMQNTFAASILGPYFGITLSMVAVTLTETGIAQTLLSLMPVMIIPVVWIVHGQRTNLRGIVGAMVAVLGVAIIFLS